MPDDSPLVIAHPCPCCGHRTLPALPPGTGAVCPVCYWQDARPDQPSHNAVRLDVAQENYALFLSSDEQWLDQVRSPRPEERRDAGWTPVDLFDAADRMWVDRDALLDLIAQAFAGVSREGGISLHGTQVLDDWGTRDAALAVAELDTDTDWTEVPTADLQRFDSALSFLDPIGFRYYLPAYMTWDLSRCLGLDALWFESHLLFHLGYIAQDDDGQKEYRRTSLLDARQRNAALRYLRFIADYGTESSSREALAAIALLCHRWS